MDDDDFRYKEITLWERIKRKTEKSPALVVGSIGFAAVVGYGAYKFKNRGNFPISLYLINLRLAAQGTIISCLMVGMMYQFYKLNIAPPDPQDK